MRPPGPTYWLLDGQTGWRTAEFDDTNPFNVSVGAKSGIRLLADPEGPTALTTAGLGGLTLPCGMAFDQNGILYLLEREQPRLKRFNPKTERFERLPTIGGEGSEAREFSQPRNIAIAGGNLYVADTGNHRVQVFDLDSLALRYVWAGGDGVPLNWKPYDVTVQANMAYILDHQNGRVYRHRPGTDFLTLIVKERSAAECWKRLAVDHRHYIILLVQPEMNVPDDDQSISIASPYLEIYDDRGQPVGHALDAGDVRDNFDTPLIRLDHQERFHLPARLVGNGLLRATDILDLRCLILKLKQPTDPISDYLKTGFASNTQNLIDDYDENEIPSEELGKALLKEINQLLQWEKLHTKEPFKVLPLSESAYRVLRAEPTGRLLVHLNRLLLEIAYPNELVAGCWLWQYGPQAKEEPPSLDEPLLLYPIWARGGLIFNRDGNPVKVAPAERAGPKLFVTQGVWYSEALDSQIYDCQWHRLQIALNALPAGSRVVIRTYADNQFRSSEEIRNLSDHLWDTNYALVGQMQPPPAANEIRQAQDRELLILSHEGQYLWLKIELDSDGYGTPAIQAIRADYPRQSYLNYLPAVYSADEESRRFLERFLSIFQTTWDDLEIRINEMARYFDPKAVPDEESLTYLAGWLALPLEGSWTLEQKRNLLMAAPKITSKRGTLEGLNRYLQVYLQNMTGLALEKLLGFPQIVEGFRERQFLMLSVQDVANLDHGAPLWGPSFVGRLQLGVFAREGQVRLVSTGDPERDVFHEFAHRFRVFVPSCWIKTGADERMLRRALDEEKPAHAKYDLCLVEPRFRVGLQSTVGLDTIIGNYPVTRLVCSHEDDMPPGQPPRHRLGYDTVLSGGKTGKSGLKLRPSTRVGLDTILI